MCQPPLTSPRGTRAAQRVPGWPPSPGSAVAAAPAAPKPPQPPPAPGTSSRQRSASPPTALPQALLPHSSDFPINFPPTLINTDPSNKQHTSREGGGSTFVSLVGLAHRGYRSCSSDAAGEGAHWSCNCSSPLPATRSRSRPDQLCWKGTRRSSAGAPAPPLAAAIGSVVLCKAALASAASLRIQLLLSSGASPEPISTAQGRPWSWGRLGRSGGGRAAQLHVVQPKSKHLGGIFLTTRI